jgi:hypothetical protein
LQPDAHPVHEGVARAVSTRSRIIAAQAVLVGVLIVVVFVTILRPEGEQSLLGIDAPGGNAPTTSPTPGPQAEEEAGGQGNGQPSNGGQPGGGDGPQGAGTAPESGLPSTVPPSGAPTFDDDSPADDQYSDTLTEIIGRLD